MCNKIPEAPPMGAMFGIQPPPSDSKIEASKKMPRPESKAGNAGNGLLFTATDLLGIKLKKTEQNPASAGTAGLSIAEQAMAQGKRLRARPVETKQEISDVQPTAQPLTHKQILAKAKADRDQKQQQLTSSGKDEVQIKPPKATPLPVKKWAPVVTRPQPAAHNTAPSSTIEAEDKVKKNDKAPVGKLNVDAHLKRMDESSIEVKAGQTDRIAAKFGNKPETNPSAPLSKKEYTALKKQNPATVTEAQRMQIKAYEAKELVMQQRREELERARAGHARSEASEASDESPAPSGPVVASEEDIQELSKYYDSIKETYKKYLQQSEALEQEAEKRGDSIKLLDVMGIYNSLNELCEYINKVSDDKKIDFDHQKQLISNCYAAMRECQIALNKVRYELYPNAVINQPVAPNQNFDLALNKSALLQEHADICVHIFNLNSEDKALKRTLPSLNIPVEAGKDTAKILSQYLSAQVKNVDNENDFRVLRALLNRTWALLGVMPKPEAIMIEQANPLAQPKIIKSWGAYFREITIDIFTLAFFKRMLFSK